MSRLRLIGLALLCILVVPFPVIAGDFDGSKPLLFAVIEVIECGPNGECSKVTPESIALSKDLSRGRESREEVYHYRKHGTD